MTDTTAATGNVETTVENSVVEGAEYSASSVLDSSVLTKDTNSEYGYVPEKFMKEGNPDFETMAKSYEELETKLRTTRPSAPKTVDEYAYEFPEGFQVDEEATNAFKAEALEAGLSVDQYKFIMDKYATSINQAVGMTQETAQKELQDYWGQNFEDNLSNAQYAFQQIGKDLNLDVNKVGNDPNVLKILSWIGTQIREDDVSDVQAGGGDPGLTDTEISDLMSRPDYWTNKEIQAKVSAAYAKRRGR